MDGRQGRKRGAEEKKKRTNLVGEDGKGCWMVVLTKESSQKERRREKEGGEGGKKTVVSVEEERRSDERRDEERGGRRRLTSRLLTYEGREVRRGKLMVGVGGQRSKSSTNCFDF